MVKLKYIGLGLWIIFIILILIDPMISSDNFITLVPEQYQRYVPEYAPLTQVIFGVCVYLLMLTADLIGSNYYTVNIWVFVIIWPTLLTYLIIKKS